MVKFPDDSLTPDGTYEVTVNANIDGDGDKIADIGGNPVEKANFFDNRGLSGRKSYVLLRGFKSYGKRKFFLALEPGRICSCSRNELAVFLEHRPRCFLSMCLRRNWLCCEYRLAEHSFALNKYEK